MDITEILAELPKSTAHTLQLKLEDCAVSDHLTEDEAREIVNGVVEAITMEEKHGGAAPARVFQLLDMVTEAVVDKIFH